MAKIENKSDLKPNKDAVEAPEKVAQAPQTEKLETPENPKKPDAKEAPKKPEPPHKKHHSGRKFVFFIFLLLLGGVAFLAIQLEQAKKLNAESLQQMQASYDEKLGALANRVNGLNREVTALKERPIVEQVAGVSENQVNQKIAALREELAAYLTPENVENEAETVAETTENAQTKEAGQVLFAPEIAALAADEKKTQEILLASGAIIVRDLAEQGVSFAYEAEVLQILARGNELAEEYVHTIRNFANTGIVGKHQLIRSFDKIFAELNEARLKVEPEPKAVEEEKQHWYDGVWAWFKRVITVKKVEKKPVFAAARDEVLELVREGRLQDALNALKTSEKYAKIDSEPLNAWKQQVEQYLQFSNAASGLIMNSLANIRLKELEHAAE